MFSPLSFYTFRSFMNSLKGDLKQSDLARRLGSTQPRIHQIFKDKLHWVYPEVRRWTRLLKLKRMEGDYFELLALLAAFPHQGDKAKLIARAFTLLGNLQDKLEPSHTEAHTVIYWLDPVARLLLALTEMDDFPVNEENIAEWVLPKVHFVAAMGSHEKAKRERIQSSWRWLCEQQLVQFRKPQARWLTNKDHPFIAESQSPELVTIREQLCGLCHVNTFLDFSREAGAGALTGFDLEMISISSAFAPLIQQVCRSFVTEEIRKIKDAIHNPDSLKTLHQTHPRLARDIERFVETLPKPDQKSDQDLYPVDTTVEILFASRSLAQSEKQDS